MTEKHLTSAYAKELDEVELLNNGFVVARVGFAFELYLSNGQAVETRLALCKILREYHALFSRQLSHFLTVNANRLTKIDGDGYLDYYEEKASMLSPDEPMDAMVFGYPAKKIIDEPQAVTISFTASGPEPLFPHGNSSICVYFPCSFIADKGYQYFRNLIGRWSSMVDAVHGSAGYSVLFEHGAFSGSSGGVATFPALKRFPGLDFSDPNIFQVEAARSDGLFIKSINWLTVLCDQIVERLGGKQALETGLGSSCPVFDFKGGVIVQAGDEPQMGDEDRGIVLNDYRRVSNALKPVRFEEYKLALIALPDPYDDIEETLEWIRRFD
jgi:hypothetical protein